MLYTRESIAQVLSQGIATVVFTKLDGTERVMHCTIAPHMIPEEKMPRNTHMGFQMNLAVLKVYDVDFGQWRSFRVNSVTDLSVGYFDENQLDLLIG
jgi:WYL_2, Sm-like SH3 beta-barrel fold